MTALPGRSGNGASTGGWDTVFAVRDSVLNAQIAKSKSSPTTFSYDDTIDHYSLSGSFGTWQVAPTGGQDGAVPLLVPFDGTLTTLTGSTVPVSGVATVVVRLKFWPKPSTDGSGATIHELKVDTDTTDNDAVAKIQHPIDFNAPVPPGQDALAVKYCLQEWLIENIGAFEHVFASVALNKKAAKGAFQWLQPTACSYGYTQMIDGGALGVLCMSEGRSAEGLVQSLSSQAIPTDQNAAFLISGPRMMQKMVLPAMPDLFPGSTADDFKLSSTGLTIENVNDKVHIEVKDKKGDKKKAFIEALDITLGDTGMTLSATTNTKITDGFHSYCQNVYTIGVKLVNKTGTSEQTLKYTTSQLGKPLHWTKKSKNYQVTSTVLEIVGAIIAYISFVLSDGVSAAVITGIIMAMMGQTMKITAEIITAVGKGEAPPLKEFLNIAGGSVIWADSQDFTLSEADLNLSLQLSGALHPATPG